MPNRPITIREAVVGDAPFLQAMIWEALLASPKFLEEHGIEIMRAAAKTEPEIADLVRHVMKERWENMETVARHVAAHGPLRGGLSMSQAADTVWALTSPELFTLLTGDRGWSREDYSEWLATSLIRLLLP